MTQNTLFLFILFIPIILISYCIIDYSKFKKKVILQNKTIKKSISKEKQLSKKLEFTDTKIEEMERNTKIQFQKIKVSVFNIKFEFLEIF